MMPAFLLALLVGSALCFIPPIKSRRAHRLRDEPRFPDAFTRGGTLRVLLVDTNGNARTQTYDRSFLATPVTARFLRLDGLLAQLKTKNMSKGAMEQISERDEDFATPLVAVFTALSRLSDHTDGYDLTGNGLLGTKGRVAILRAGETDYEDFPEPLAESIATEARRLIAERGL